MNDEKGLAQGESREPPAQVDTRELTPTQSTETSSLNIAGSPGVPLPDGQPRDQQNVSYKPKASRTRGPTVQDITQEFTKAASGVIFFIYYKSSFGSDC